MPDLNVDVFVGFYGFDSEVLSNNHFGTNMLFHSDNTELGSDFRQVIENAAISLLRYPGGTISEEYFDPLDPNATHQTNVIDIMSGASNVRSQDVEPLADFLAYSREIDARAAIVLPTYRYFDTKTGSLLANAEGEIKSFVKELLAGTYGATDNIVLELGNEWYQHRFNWTKEEFGNTQAILATWIHEEAMGLGMRDNLTILAQAGRSSAENETLASFFEGPAQFTIDGVLTHLYGTNSQGNPLGLGSGIDMRLDDINAVWGAVLGPDFDLAVTEWNVGENGEDDTIINGLMRVAPLLRMFGEMQSNGVDLAMIWAAQTNGPAGLSGPEGTGSEMSPTGYFYSMLSHSLPGMRMIDTGSGFRMRDSAGNIIGYAYSFIEDQNLVSYFASGIDESVAIEVDLSGFEAANAYVYATVLGAAPGESGLSYQAEASIRHISNIDLTGVFSNGWHFAHELGAYELVELHVVVGEGVAIFGDTQNAISDALTGSAFDDHLAGNLGDDILVGQSGQDLLQGGVGDDWIEGGSDHDTLDGGDGNDTLYGEHGIDVLVGGSGDDYLDGGNWHDQLSGGAGDDTLIGGAGDDFLEMGDGSGIADGGSGQDMLSFQGATDRVTVWTREGIVELANQDHVEFFNFEAIQGSQFADRFSIDATGGQYYGEDGTDSFELLGGSDNVIDMGNGDDRAFVYANSNSVISGGEGNDRFMTFAGTNRLSGDAGDDTFVLASSDRDVLVFRSGDDDDNVNLFQTGIDQIEFHGLTQNQLSIVESSTGTLLDFGEQGSVFLNGVLSLEAGIDFVFL